ncbi:MAG: fructosamine kinase family protein [Candidatus Pelagadaptatus aseana]|uniref:fructosamine kinase family protein n=1 Tax=Candidatus Pelagadaptatus aseana TaxID=3120508 RepID=UPI0039B1E281
MLSTDQTKSISDLFEHISQGLPSPLSKQSDQIRIQNVQGGDINQSYRIDTTTGQYFLKVNRCDQLPMFVAEKNGLNAIAESATIATCNAISWGQHQEQAYLLLAALNIEHHGDWRVAGQQLATMHLAPAGTNYGWHQDSYCGTTLQNNSWADNWAKFFAEQRIGRQLELLQQHSDRQRQQCIDAIARQLETHQPPPSLVHGDLWSGNIGFCNHQPVIFDPACYIGDSETDLAMTELFGRFPDEFYRGYHDTKPIPAQYQQRRDIYQLYHLLNHANLFGGSYLGSASRLLKRIMER